MFKETQIIIVIIPVSIIIWFARKESGDISPSLTPNSLNLEKGHSIHSQ